MKELRNGWVEGSVQEFLDLSDADMEYIETRRALARCLRAMRLEKGMTQTQLAASLRTSQSRLAKMEAGDSSVSLDLLFKAVYRAGATRRKVAAAL